MSERLAPKLTVALLCAVSVLTGLTLGVPLGMHLPKRGPFMRGGPPGDPVDMFAKRRKLRPDQIDAVRAILDRYRPRFDAADQARRDTHKALRDQADAEFREVLDDAQFERLLAMRAELERRDRGPRPPPPR